jgi:ubiquinone biosynthesis monooxygenase Coq7
MYIKQPTYLPGDNKDKFHEMLRVNHSGELGAINLYKGQIAAIKHLSIIEKQRTLLETLNEMYNQEMVHYQYFKLAIEQHKVRPSFLTPIWSQLGFTIGYITGILGQKTAMTLTAGVETVIGNHYKEQLNIIENMLPSNGALDELKSKISQFMEEELEHLDIATAYHAEEMYRYFYLRKLIEIATNIAISIAKRL